MDPLAYGAEQALPLTGTETGTLMCVVVGAC